MIDPKILHKKFIRFGLQRHKLKNEMLAILPQIYKSGIYKKYATSIYEYAGKYGDISKSAVETRLRIESNLAGKPHLKAAIKEVGVNKVAMIVKLATPETDEMFADKVMNMSKPAIQMLSKELRSNRNGDVNGTLCCAIPEKIKIELDEEMTFLFLKLKEKMGKMTNKEVMKIILKKMASTEFGRKKPGATKKLKSLTGQRCAKSKNSKNTTDQGLIEKRHIRAERKREELKKTNGKCSYPGCNRPAQVFHHQDRYSENKNHKNLKGLCREHHEFMHNGLIPNESDSPNEWKIQIKNKLKNPADILYRKYRQKALQKL